MREILESRATRLLWDAKRNPANFTPSQEFRIRQVYESKTRTKNDFMRLRLEGNAYEFSYFGKKNRYLNCPETHFVFYSNGVCQMSKDNAQGTRKEKKYYEY